MIESILIIIGILFAIYGLYLLSCMLSDMMKNLHDECINQIEENDKKLEEQYKLNKALKKWLFR